MIPYRIVFHPEAEKEFLKSYQWYEERSIGLGDRFSKAIDNKINLIVKNPLFYPKKNKDYHEVLIEVFPFLIVYKMYPDDNLIYIVSIAHTSRKPNRKYRN